MAHPMPIGMEMTAAPRVTNREPRIKGSIPNCAGSEIGYQLLPNRKSSGVTILKTERPSLSRKRKIKPTKNIEARPQINMSFSIINSLTLRIVWNYQHYYVKTWTLFENRHKISSQNNILSFFR